MKKAIYMPILLISALFLINSAHAEMYKWTDKNGTTQYTQTPPPADAKVKGKDIEAEIKRSAGLANNPSAAPTNTKASPTDKTPPANKPAEGSSDLKKSEQQHHSFCDQQTEALQQLNNNALIKWKDGEKEHFLTAEEKTTKIKEISNNLASMCRPEMFSTQNSTVSPPADTKTTTDSSKKTTDAVEQTH
jgi:hypothetical protein